MMKKNSGLSIAYNKAADFAFHKGFEWLILLDQDTLFPENILNDYIDVIKNNPDIKLIAPRLMTSVGLYMSPVKMRFYSGVLSKDVPHGITDLHKYVPVNSGIMVNVKAFLECGGYNPKVKVDFSDYQFIERFRKKYSQFYILKQDCFQEFSNLLQTSEEKNKRFELFCDCLKNCEKNSFKEKMIYGYLIIKRAFSIIFSTGSLRPIKTVFKKYFNI